MNIKSNPLINLEINDNVYDYKLYSSLKSLSSTYSQRKSAKELGISHAVLNRRILKAEEKLGFKLVRKVGSGSELTKEGYELLNEFSKYENKVKEEESICIGGGHIISGLLQSMNLPFDVSIFSSTDEDAFKLAKKGIIDLLVLDDPLIAFNNDLNFIPIAYDNLVLISNRNSKEIKNIHDLEGLKFVSVKGSAQRLAWNTLKQYNINFTIEKEVNSQFDAYKTVKNSDNLYSFLNASYFHGNNILNFETKHTLGLIQFNEEKREIEELIKFIQSKCQNIISNQGLIPIKNYL